MGDAAKSLTLEPAPLLPTLPLEKRRLGRSELQVSPLGFGSLRLTPEDGIYKETLYRALQYGVHFIDTAGAYGNGASEMLIGEVLRDYLGENAKARGSIVLCTKMGPVQGASLNEAPGGLRRQPGSFALSEKASYCLTPEYLESQITLSLRRLQVDKVNLVLVQNPEHLIRHLPRKADFFAYLKRAFEHLEVEVARGRIDHYGISSSAFLKKEIEPHFLSLHEMVELAQSITRRHHFSVTQIPFNLFETTPLFQANQRKMSFFAAAAMYDLGILTCRPLTAHHRDKVHHFITFPGKDEVSVKGQLHQSLMDVIELEKQLQERGLRHAHLNWGHVLRDHLHSISDWWKWNLYLHKEILPSLQDGIDSLPDTPEFNHWKVTYVNQLHELFTWVTDSLQGIANLRTNQICRYLNQECSVLKDESKLSNKVTRLYLSLPQIGSIVMGLSHPQHVEDLLSLGEIPNTEMATRILQRVKMQF